MIGIFQCYRKFQNPLLPVQLIVKLGYLIIIIYYRGDVGMISPLILVKFQLDSGGAESVGPQGD